MRNDHVFYGLVGGRYPAPEEIEYHLGAARRLRAEAVHELLARAAEWIRAAFGRSRGRRGARLQHC